MAQSIVFQARRPISGDFVQARLTLEQRQDQVFFTLDIPPNEGDLLGLFGNITDESMVTQLTLIDPAGIITETQFKANSVTQVGGGNNVNPAKNWDWGLKFGQQGSASGAVLHVTFALAAPGLTLNHFTRALNQDWLFGVRSQSTNGPEGSSKMGIEAGDVINRPPVILSQGPEATRACDVFTLALSAQDPDGDLLSWSLIDGPVGMTLNQAVLSWSPSLEQQGSYPISILADDLRGGTASLDFSLTVSAPAGEAPVFSVFPQEPINSGNLYSLVPLATDADGDLLTFSLVSAPQGLIIENNELRWTPEPDQIGDFPLEIQVTDGCFLVSSTSVLHVNAPPQFTLSLPDTLNACELFSIVLSGFDPDLDPLTWALVQAPEGLTLVENILQWYPAYDQQGSYLIAILVEDGLGASARQDFVVSVLPAVGQGPVFSALPQSIELGQVLTITPVATDADGDSLTFATIQAPEGLLLENNSLSWTPLAHQVGNHDLNLEVTDGCFTVQMQHQLQVIQPNRPPEITSTAPNNIAACELFSYTLSATDPDGDSLAYSLL